MPSLPPPLDLSPRLRQGVLEFPVHHMRGGTSTGLVINETFAPVDEALREELLRHLMGVPAQGRRPGNRQITGLGRGPATSNKVFFAHMETTPQGLQLVSTLAQLAAEHAAVDWSVNCGNMSSALQLWALDCELLPMPAPGAASQVLIRNTNTGVISTSRVQVDARQRFVTTGIPGVMGEFASVDLFLHQPVGAKTGTLLPTGRAVDIIEGYRASCVDVAVPMVICEAAEFGKTAQETVAELEADAAFMAAFREVWIQAGLRMGLRQRDGSLLSREQVAASETIPKACIVGPPRAGGHIAVRYFTPQTAHASMAVSGGCCLAAATLIPGTVAHEIARGVAAPGSAMSEVGVDIENPAGVLATTIVARRSGADIEVSSAAYRRSAQVLLRGHVPVYAASPALIAAVLGTRAV